MSPAALVLVVDDDEGLRDALETILEHEGYRVRVAANGRAALAQVAETSPDLILLDVRMPVMDGRGFVEAYRQMPGPHAAIVILTASEDAATNIEDIGADACLMKPIELTDLLDAVRKHTGAGEGKV